jgi:catechol 2,3-dioxygenase-like lactoylglutathione lyase family enzyme
VIHHAGLEIRPAAADGEVAFWALLGYLEVAPPAPSLAERSRWVQSADGAQVHLLLVEHPMVPDTGHVAVVAEDYEAVVGALRAAGHEAADRERYWGARRTQVISPAGHRVEIMAAPPPGR